MVVPALALENGDYEPRPYKSIAHQKLITTGKGYNLFPVAYLRDITYTSRLFLITRAACLIAMTAGCPATLDTGVPRIPLRIFAV